MTQVQIDNTPVQEQLSGNETVSVPTGETWKVTLYPDEFGTDRDTYASRLEYPNYTINGTTYPFPTQTIAPTSGDEVTGTVKPIELVLTEGTTIGVGTYTNDLLINGWVL